MTDPRTNTVPDVAPVLRVVDDAMTRSGLTQSNVHGYRTVRFSALRSGDALDLTSKQLTGSSADEYTVMVLDTEGYAGLTGEQVTACARRGARMDGRRSPWRYAHARRRYAAAAAAR